MAKSSPCWASEAPADVAGAGIMAEVSWATWQSSACIRACQQSGKAMVLSALYIRNM